MPRLILPAARSSWQDLVCLGCQTERVSMEPVVVDTVTPRCNSHALALIGTAVLQRKRWLQLFVQTQRAVCEYIS